MHHRDERGQVAPLLALFAVAVGLACLGLGRFAGGAVDAASARTAADAAALAGASGGGEAAARSLATANGARLVSYESAGGDVRVRVRVGPHTVSARARSSGRDDSDPSVPSRPDSGARRCGPFAPPDPVHFGRCDRRLPAEGRG